MKYKHKIFRTLQLSFLIKYAFCVPTQPFGRRNLQHYKRLPSRKFAKRTHETANGRAHCLYCLRVLLLNIQQQQTRDIISHFRRCSGLFFPLSSLVRRAFVCVHVCIYKCHGYLTFAGGCWTRPTSHSVSKPGRHLAQRVTVNWDDSWKRVSARK